MNRLRRFTSSMYPEISRGPQFLFRIWKVFIGPAVSKSAIRNWERGVYLLEGEQMRADVSCRLYGRYGASRPARKSRLKPTPRCTSARESILEGEAAGATQSFHAYQRETAY